MPYSRASIFTRGWLRDFQAHHILERHIGKDIFKMEAQAIDEIPAVILTAKEHKKITNELSAAYKELRRDLNGKTPDKAQVWAMYQQVYKDYPNWLKAIKGYF